MDTTAAMDGATNIERVEILNGDDVPRRLFKIDFRAIDYSPSSPSRHGFSALNPKEPFPLSKDANDASFSRRAARSEGNTKQNIFASMLTSNNFIALLGDWEAIEAECGTTKISGTKEMWRIYQVSTKKLQRLGISIVKGKSIYYKNWARENATGTQLFATYLIWGHIPPEAIKGSYAVGSVDLEKRKDRVLAFEALNVPELIAKENARKRSKSLDDMANQFRSYDKSIPREALKKAKAALAKELRPIAVKRSASSIGNKSFRDSWNSPARNIYVPKDSLSSANQPPNSLKGKERETYTLPPPLQPFSTFITGLNNVGPPNPLRTYQIPFSSLPQDPFFTNSSDHSSMSKRRRSNMSSSNDFSPLGPTLLGPSSTQANLPTSAMAAAINQPRTKPPLVNSSTIHLLRTLASATGQSSGGSSLMNTPTFNPPPTSESSQLRNTVSTTDSSLESEGRSRRVRKAIPTYNVKILAGTASHTRQKHTKNQNNTHALNAENSDTIANPSRTGRKSSVPGLRTLLPSTKPTNPSPLKKTHSFGEGSEVIDLTEDTSPVQQQQQQQQRRRRRSSAKGPRMVLPFTKPTNPSPLKRTRNSGEGPEAIDRSEGTSPVQQRRSSASWAENYRFPKNSIPHASSQGSTSGASTFMQAQPHSSSRVNSSSPIYAAPQNDKGIDFHALWYQPPMRSSNSAPQYSNSTPSTEGGKPQEPSRAAGRHKNHSTPHNSSGYGPTGEPSSFASYSGIGKSPTLNYTEVHASETASTNGEQSMQFDQEQMILGHLRAISVQMAETKDSREKSRLDIEYQNTLKSLETLRGQLTVDPSSAQEKLRFSRETNSFVPKRSF